MFLGGLHILWNLKPRHMFLLTVFLFISTKIFKDRDRSYLRTHILITLPMYTLHMLNVHVAEAYDTHNMMHFCCDITVILYCIQADTLDANLQQKSQVQMKTLCKYVEKQVTCFCHGKSPWYICGENVLCQKPFVCTVHTAFDFTSLQQQWEKH